MTTVFTGIRCSPNEWDGERVKTEGSEVINAKLADKKSSIDRSIAYLSIDNGFDSMTASDIKKVITGKKERHSGHLVSDLFAEYLSTDISEGTKEIYRATLAKVLSFGGKTLKMENIDLKWLHQFERFLSKTQGINGRAIYLRSLRAVCNYSAHQYNLPYAFRNFSIRQEPTRKRSVSVELFRKFLRCPTTSANNRYRDYFKLMFYLIGINSKDLLLARKDNLVNGRLEYNRAKTHKRYSIKIEPEAEELLNEYSGKDYLLEAMDRCKLYKSFAHEMNDALKTIGDVRWETVPDPDDLFAPPRLEKIVTPIIPDVSTYFARHCWATFAHEAGISTACNGECRGYDQNLRDRVGAYSRGYLAHKHILSVLPISPKTPTSPAGIKTIIVGGGGGIANLQKKGWGVLYRIGILFFFVSVAWSNVLSPGMSVYDLPKRQA